MVVLKAVQFILFSWGTSCQYLTDY